MKRTTSKRKPAESYRSRPVGVPYRPSQDEQAPYRQAQSIFDRFGGPNALSFALNQLPDKRYHRDRTIVYRWAYPRSKNGTGGTVPYNMVRAVKAAARLMGVVLTEHDWRLE